MSTISHEPERIDQGDNVNWAVIKSALVVASAFFFLMIGGPFVTLSIKYSFERALLVEKMVLRKGTGMLVLLLI